jgi:hypothetical protein
MSTQKSLLLLTKRAWRRDELGKSSLPLELRQRWWRETDYSRKPLGASKELIEILKNHKRALARSASHPTVRRETWAETFGDARYEVTLRLRADDPFLLRIMPASAPASPTMTRRMIGEGHQFLLCVESTVPDEIIRAALARLPKVRNEA